MNYNTKVVYRKEKLDEDKIIEFIKQRNKLLSYECNYIKEELKKELTETKRKRLEFDLILIKGRIREITKMNVLFGKKFTPPDDLLKGESILDYFMRYEKVRVEKYKEKGKVVWARKRNENQM